MIKKTFKDVDDYLSTQTPSTRQMLETLRQAIRSTAPAAEEMISYQMPAYKLNGQLVFFAGYKNHIGFYPTGSGIKNFEKELSAYKGSKGAVQFPLDKPLPLALIKKIVKFRVQENMARAAEKKTVVKKTVTKKPEEDKTDPAAVTAHIKKLEPALAKVVQYIRTVILSSGKDIGERIKWNNPSFFYTGRMKPFDPKEYKREIAVFNLFKGRIMLVLPAGAKLGDKSGLLEGDYKDGRRLIIFKDLKDAQAKEKALKKIIATWLKMVDK